MTILAQLDVRQLYFRGDDDPSLPVGMWWTSGTVTGDASGGFMAVRSVFHQEGQGVSSDSFSLEQISGLLSITTVTNGFLRTVGMAPQPKVAAFDRMWQLVFEDLDSGLGNQALGAAVKQLLPLWIGTQRSADRDDLGTLEIGTTNLGAGDSLSVSCMGYRWTSRSIMAPGGPRRPPGSIFGGS